MLLDPGGRLFGIADRVLRLVAKVDTAVEQILAKPRQLADFSTGCLPVDTRDQQSFGLSPREQLGCDRNALLRARQGHDAIGLRRQLGRRARGRACEQQEAGAD